jgi:hypothetical protein
MNMIAFVGWVERSDTHHCRAIFSMGIARLNPSYESEPRP